MIDCEFCHLTVSKSNYSKHKKTDLCKNINTIIKNNIEENEIKLNEYIKKNEKLKEENILLNNKILTSEIKLKDALDKSEEYRIFFENYTTSKFKIKKEISENIESNNTFEIDINITNKQLNKTKYKNIAEDQFKKELQLLKLKDNYQLEYRDDDGFINITNLCKAGGKKFNDWNRLDKTKRFLNVLSSNAGIPVIELLKQEQGGNGERHTWAHPQVSINIAQWISPEFDVLVSKWVYEIILTGKLDIRDNKTTQELDIMNKENKLLKNRIKLLESKVLQKQPRETFEENKNVVYIITTEYKEAQGHYKIGKAQDLQKRLSTLNTSDKHEVIYNTSCKSKKKMDLLEQLVHDKLEDKRIEPNKEWFESEEDAEDLIKIIEEFKKINNL
jgi:hypothetical protein